MEYENVLIPCDFSKYSKAAVQRVTEIHGIKKITLLHVVLPHEPFLNKQQNNHKDSVLTAEENLQQDKQFFEQQGILAKILIEPIHTHFVARTILDIAKTTDTSLIVIGAHGMNKIREFLLGSVLHEVVRNARQHVLLIHAHNNASDHKQENQAACPLLFLISSLPP